MSSGMSPAVNRDDDLSFESVKRPAKQMKLDDGRSTSLSAGRLNVSNANGSALPHVFGAGSMPGKPVPNPEEVQQSEKQTSQVMSSLGDFFVLFLFVLFQFTSRVFASLVFKPDIIV